MKVAYRNQGTPEAFLYTGSNYYDLWEFAQEHIFSMDDEVYLKISHGLVQEVMPYSYVVRHTDGVYRVYSQSEFHKIFVPLA